MNSSTTSPRWVLSQMLVAGCLAVLRILEAALLFNVLEHAVS
jgi:hypothetical protein